jgi:hypothetical protein
MNQAFVESGTDFSTHHGLPIFSEKIHWLSRDVDLTPGELDYTHRKDSALLSPTTCFMRRPTDCYT